MSMAVLQLTSPRHDESHDLIQGHVCGDNCEWGRQGRGEEKLYVPALGACGKWDRALCAGMLLI